MPLNVQVTGTAASGRKNGVDYKVQTSGTAAWGRTDVTEIWYQAESGLKPVWCKTLDYAEYYHNFDQMSGSDEWKEYILYYPGVPIWFTYNTPKEVINRFFAFTWVQSDTIQLLRSPANLWWNPDLETFDYPYRTPEYWNEPIPYRYGFGVIVNM